MTNIGKIKSVTLDGKTFDVTEHENEIGLINCKCGASGIHVYDDGDELFIKCESCGEMTDEYYYGASSYEGTYQMVIKEWNEMNRQTELE